MDQLILNMSNRHAILKKLLSKKVELSKIRVIKDSSYRKFELLKVRVKKKFELPENSNFRNFLNSKYQIIIDYSYF